MILFDLLIGFLKVGCFAFGGAYGAIPLIRDMVLANGWLDDEKISYMIAVSESTPGPIMVNMATYVGSTQGGFWGAVLSTLAVVIVTLLIGFTAVAGLFSMPVMPISFLAWMAGLMVVYTVLAQIMKVVYIRINKEWV